MLLPRSAVCTVEYLCLGYTEAHRTSLQNLGITSLKVTASDGKLLWLGIIN